MKGAHIPGWPEDRQSVAAQITVSKKKEGRLRKDKLIWTVRETYFILFKYVDGFMFKKKIDLASGKVPPREEKQQCKCEIHLPEGKSQPLWCQTSSSWFTASVCSANHTDGDAEQGPLSIPSSGELGTTAVFQTCSELIYSFPLLFFLTLKLQRLLKYNKMHRRATHMTNSTYRCTHNRCTLVKVPSQSADISPVKWRVPSCELDSFALETW